MTPWKTQSTDWMDFPGDSRIPRYRIEKRYDGASWNQRHIWMHFDGCVEIGKWIGSAPGFIDGSTSVTGD